MSSSRRLDKIITLAKAIGAAAGIALSATSAQAAPFTCSGEIYQVQSGQLRVFNPIISSYVDVGTNQGSYNATGYNVLDNFAYGSQGNNVIRIHSDGSTEVAYNVGFGGFAGDVDDSNNYFVRRSNTSYSSINLATGAVTTLNFSGSTVSGADAVFVRNAGIPYLVMVTTNQIGIVNLNTSVSVAKSISGLPGGGFGATWSDFNGRVFTFNNNTGEIFELFNLFSASPSATLAAQGDPSGNNDGFSCPQAPFPNLPPVAKDDSFTTPFETVRTGNVIASNGNGVDFDPESGPITVNTVLVAGPTNGSATLGANGAFTYTPNAGFYGTDTFRYQIVDQTGLTDTATVTITVPAPPIDLVTVKTLASGNTNPSVGDTVTFLISVTNNGPAGATGVSLSDVIPSGLTATANNGAVTAGSYNSTNGLWALGAIAAGATQTLTIEGIVEPAAGGTMLQNTTTIAAGDQSDPTNSGNDLMESIVIFPLTLLASSDASDDIVSGNGSASALQVLDGDTISGTAVTTADVTINLAAGETVPTGLTFDTATGIVGVAPGTAPGIYAFDYQICEIANPLNCATATATVTVIANPIMAANDSAAGVIGAVGANAVLNVLAGDTVNGFAASTGNTVISVAAGSVVPAQLVFNTVNGNVDVAAGTAAGTYSFDYQICETADPDNCAVATVEVMVDASDISASPDSPAPVNGASGNPNVINAFANDLLNGSQVDPADISANITMPAVPVRTGASVPEMDPATGNVAVPAGTPAGTYTIGYRICETLNPTNCAVATVVVVVEASLVTATDDTAIDVNGISGANDVLNLFDGDSVNGVAASPTNSSLSVASGFTVPSVLAFDPATGLVNVNANTSAGTYTFDYQICETINPTNCQTATASVTVNPSIDLSITKTNTPGVNGNIDQTDDTLFSGSSTSYTLVVTNNGPDAVSGAVVTDTPGPGISCPAVNIVNITGDGIPSGSFTVSDLTSAGITLGMLANGASATLEFTCNVN